MKNPLELLINGLFKGSNPVCLSDKTKNESEYDGGRFIFLSIALLEHTIIFLRSRIY
jgi:hypothetical protein